MSETDKFALVPRPPGALEKAEPGARRILSGMVADTLALAREELSKPAKPLRIVMLENEAFQDLCALLIRSRFQNATVLTFDDPEGALRELAREPPDIFIADWMMTCRGGWGVLRLLAERKAPFPVIVTSGHKEEVVRGSLDPNLNATFLSKPFSASRLIEAIEAALKTPRGTLERSGELATRPQGSRPLRIVLVEDGELLRDHLAARLRTLFTDAAVLPFADGDTAWQELSRADPDLLITDSLHTGLMTPEMLARLAERKAKYPILIVHGGFGKAMAENADPGLRVIQLQKPLSMDQFRQALVDCGLAPTEHSTAQPKQPDPDPV